MKTFEDSTIHKILQTLLSRNALYAYYKTVKTEYNITLSHPL